MELGYETDYQTYFPHDPKTNGLKYLWDYTKHKASKWLLDDTWTKAIFVREPKARTLSAYLDKAFYYEFIHHHCCKIRYNIGTPQQYYVNKTGCWTPDNRTFTNFVSTIIKDCNDDHWNSQNEKMESKYWKYINFVGHFDTVEEDSHRLLKRIGAWETIGKSGWGQYYNQSIFERSSNIQTHKTGVDSKKLSHWYTPQLERLVEQRYIDDYNNPLFNFTITPIDYN